MMTTNYMDLLMSNQPWNLIMYMVIPVVLAEAVVATEFYTMFLGDKKNSWHTWNKILSILAGLYFFIIFVYFLTHVMPTIQFRGIIDIIAVGFYLLGVIPLGAIALLEIGMWGKLLSPRQHQHRHFLWVIAFLVVSHVAMIFGMVNPQITGWQPPTQQEQMQDNASHDSGSAHKTPTIHK